MGNYLETIYFRDEQGEDDYPQQLCDHLIKICKLDQHVHLDLRCPVATLLDVGSGKGNQLVAFARRGLKTIGLDNRSECLEAADAVHVCDLEQQAFPIEDNSIDIVFSKSVIEHVRNADNILKESYRVLKSSGIIILMTPDWDSQHEIFWDDYTHVKPWTRKGLQDALCMHNFRKVKSTLFRQLPILWRHPWLEPICDLVSLLPHSWKWEDKEEKHFRTFIRFSKEKMILAVGKK